MPELIDRLDLEGHTVSLDAMDCQKSIAHKLSKIHSDNPLALKANHGSLHRRAEELFSSPGHLRRNRQQCGTLSTANEGNQAHGRIEGRVVLATDSLWWMNKSEREDWPDLRSVVCVESHCEQLGSGGKACNSATA